MDTLISSNKNELLSEDDSSLVVLVLNMNPLSYAITSLTSKERIEFNESLNNRMQTDNDDDENNTSENIIHLSDLLKSILIFLNSIKLLNQINHICVIASYPNGE